MGAYRKLNGLHAASANVHAANNIHAVIAHCVFHDRLRGTHARSDHARSDHAHSDHADDNQTDHADDNHTDHIDRQEDSVENIVEEKVKEDDQKEEWLLLISVFILFVVNFIHNWRFGRPGMPTGVNDS